MNRNRLLVSALVGSALGFAGTAEAQLSPADSAALNRKLRDQAFLFLMDWRIRWWHEKQDNALDKTAWQIDPTYPDMGAITAQPVDTTDDFGSDSLRSILARQSAGGAPQWVWPRTVVPLDNSRLIADLTFPDGPRQDVQKARRPLVVALDAAARKLPGDFWIVSQRVRMHVDQEDHTGALAATRECKTARWYCLALRGYVWYSMGDPVRASAVFDSTLKVAPDSVSCAWNDLSLLLTRADSADFARRSCLERDHLAQLAWWLADPLFLERGNERRTEHYGRRMLLDLRTMVDSVDGLFDYRNRPTGDGFNLGKRISEKILRYGFPVAGRGCHPITCKGDLITSPWRRYVGQPPMSRPPVQGWNRFDTKQVYLGTYARIAWLGPMYHTMPRWSAILDPLHATDVDWNLGPPYDAATHWEESWWAPELYVREAGPLFELASQVAFFRRAATAVIAAAAEWDTLTTFRKPPASALFGLAMSTGPLDPLRIVSSTVPGARPPALLSPIRSRPQLLGIEMIPVSASDGAASRTRFGVSPPPPLSELPPNTLALSDPMLVRLAPGEAGPTTLNAALARMYGTTKLIRPQRVAVAWEVYGMDNGDTVDVSVRIVRSRNTGAGLFSLLRSAFGIGSSGSGQDSVVVGWQEPRFGDQPASVDGGKTIRVRSIVFDFTALETGNYELMVTTVRRNTLPATATRTFVIAR